MKHGACTALSGVSCVSLWPKGPADLQRTGPAWPSQLPPRLLRLDLSPDLRWLRVVLLKGISPQIIPRTENAERPPWGMCFALIFPSFIRLTYPPPSASGCLKTSLGVLLLTRSPSSTHPLFIPQPVFTFDKETVRSLFSLPASARRYYGEL